MLLLRPIARSGSNFNHSPQKHVYRLLKLCDTAHDFFKGAADLDRVQAPRYLPAELSYDHVLNGVALVETLAAAKTLTFAEERVANPLFGATLTADARSDALHPVKARDPRAPHVLADAFGHDAVFQVDTTVNAMLRSLLGGSGATVSDANVFDAASVSFASARAVDARPTGPVYLDDAPYQITLLGLDAAGSVSVVLHDRRTAGAEAAAPLTLVFSDRDATAWCSKRMVHSAKPSSPFATCRPALRYAVKRAGDWGQVEHARRYGKVFVTGDRLAALYAWYRDVPFVYTRDATLVVRPRPPVIVPPVTT